MKIAASGTATLLAIVLVAGTAGARLEHPPEITATAAQTVMLESPIPGVPGDALPREGACRIWYDSLPVERQPAQMDCVHAHWLAQRWGGRVIDRHAEQAAYVGRNDFSGVPARALPRPGYCRVWVDGDALEAQPAESDCVTARHMAAERGGRVLFMPL